MTQPVHLEKKQVVASVVSLLAGAGVAVLNGLAGSQLLGSLNSTDQTLILSLVPGLVTFLTTYATPHTERPDLAVSQTPPAPEPLVLGPEP